METKLHVFVCQTFAHHSYPEFDQKLPELRAIPLMHSIWAARTVLTAKELKDALRKTLDDSDRILVVEVSAGWAKPASGKQSGRFTSTPRGYGSRTVEAALGRMSEPKSRAAGFAAIFWVTGTLSANGDYRLIGQQFSHKTSSLERRPLNLA
jgi:hypothetical protein